ncbi:MAG: sodium/proton-translocating pyrophosphatase, partial [Nocardioidaceae bacterium]
MPDSALSGGDKTWVVIALVVSLAALGFAAYLIRAVMAADQGTTTMRDISRAVQEGAAAYLRRQFKTLSIFAVIVFLLLLVLPVTEGGVGTRIGRAVFFLIGATFSALVGFIGMTLATRGNVRVAAAARAGGYRPAFRIAYRTGGVVGMITVGLGLLGASVVVLGFQETAPVVLEGFGFGGALLAMFMRVGGGIFTKAADVGADLVGKVEAGIPEDDPRNAATIADNVGDNVGDCAGMAADLFESYAVTLVAALILGQVAFGAIGMVFPLIVAAIGVLSSVVGILASNPGKSDRSGLAPINRGF